MLKIELIRFETTDIITSSLVTVTPASPNKPSVHDPNGRPS